MGPIRRLRARLLGAVQSLAERNPAIFERVREAVPEELWRRIRQVGAPVRIPGRGGATGSLDSIEDEDEDGDEDGDGAPFASIVVPVFNQWAHTRLCLASIRRYTLAPAYEIVVCDDGSSDGTPERLAELATRWRALRTV